METRDFHLREIPRGRKIRKRDAGPRRGATVTRDEIKTVLAAMLAVMGKIAEKTRTPADDMMVAILKANEEKLTTALVSLLSDPAQPPSGERVTEALNTVGIRV
jgi:hypothetical protein